MVSVRIKGFGGMVPAIDDRLLPDNQAARSEDAWLNSGALIGLPQMTLLHTCTTPSTGKVYRLPASYTSAQTFDDSTWMEFTNAFTDVIRAPVVDDEYDRYYWVSSSDVPRYNTRARIEYSLNPVSNVVTFTNATELVNWTAHPLEIGDKIRFSNSGGGLPTGISAGTDYFVAVTSYGANSFRLSTTLHGAINGTALVTFSTDGTGTNTLTTQTHSAWKLGIPAPSGAPSIIVTGGSAPTTTRSYVCTYVTAYGEEGPPSDPVTTTGNIDGSWDITLPATVAADLGVDRYLTLVRIYRTVVSASGEATYFFVAEQNINDTTYSDVLSDTTVSANEDLPSNTWEAPPTDLIGWILMPNGYLIGWRSNELWFSEPYRPHAWNAENTLAIEYPIVGLGVINQTAAICTTGFPMTGVGVNPSSFTTSKLANFEPCVARGSIISAPEGVYYASGNGLIRIVPGKAVNITSNIISKDRWQSLTQIEQLRFARLGTALYGFGTVATGVFEVDAFETTAFVQEDVSGALAGILLDVTNERVALNILNSDDQTVNVFNDVWSSEVFVIRDNEVLWLDQGNPDPTYEPFLWRSKVIQFDKKLNLGAARVYFEVPANTPAQAATADNTTIQTLSTDQYGLLRVYADGTLVATRELRTSGERIRLPSGFKADFWQFEIEARVRVFSFQAASTMKELASA
jgi:hypothetical protein